MEYRYLGILKEDIAEYWNINEHKNKPILVFNDRKQHVIEKHLKDFGSIKIVEEVYSSLSVIINKQVMFFIMKKQKG